MADVRLSARFRAAAEAFRAPRPRPPDHSAASADVLERPVTNVVASQAVFDIVNWHLQDLADTGRAPTVREKLAHVHALAQLSRSVDQLALAYTRATENRVEA